jgi:CBS domain containing-hemolysin-like protein
MLGLLGLLVLSLLAIVTSGLRAVYGSAPLKQLQKRARQGDPVARLLQEVAQHGKASDAVLLPIMIISTALAAVVVNHIFSLLLALIFIVMLVSLVFIWSPPYNQITEKVAYLLAPYFAQLLRVLAPIAARIDGFVRRHRPLTVHTGLYDKEDLVELLEKQGHAHENQIDKSELDIAKHALLFGDKVVKDFMTPRRMVRFVSGDEPIGPVLINELHESGFSRFPVRGDDENNVVGTLFLRDLLKHQRGGIVKNVMNPDAYYVNETSTLDSVLAAFLRTKHHLFMVVNEFEEIVGLITIEDVLEQVLGRKIVDEFDRYDDLRAVAKQHASKQTEHHASKPAEVEASTTEAKVVE